MGPPDPRLAALARSPHTDTVVSSGPAEPLETTLERTPLAGDARPAPPPALPPSIGRFVPIRRLGAGGMGVVYSAYDELLDRGVAIKVLRPDRASSDAAARLLREAQTLARLSHPNVVQIYEVGFHQGQVFLAMEFVRGQTLRAWLAARWSGERAPDPRSLLPVLRAAGEGLAAAHAAGIVHRDFKPDNVIVGDDDHVRVVDFGLAATDERAPDEDLADLGGARDDHQHTRPGTRLGTLPYMPPEQLAGGRADARADVFAFSVTLYEALHGARPFTGETAEALQDAIRAGLPRDPPATTPAWLWRIVARGLACDPAGRWPTMRDLLGALQADPARSRGRRLAVAAIAVVLVGAGLGIVARQQARVRRCDAEVARVDAVWTPAARERLHAAFVATGAPHADATATRTAARLDAWTDAWRQARREVCSGEASDDRLARAHVTCLERQVWRLGGLVDAFAAADAATVQRAIAATSDLPRALRCADLRWLHASLADADEAGDLAARRAREQLERGRVRLSAGDFAGARGLADAVLASDAARSIPAIAAEAQVIVGSSERALADYEAAARRLTDAYYFAGRVGAELAAAEAAVQLMAVLGSDLSRHDEALAWARSAAMMIGRLGLDEQELGARYRMTLGVIHRHRGARDEALAAYERARTLLVADLGPGHPLVARVQSNIASLHVEAHDLAGALPHYREALAILEGAYGPDHPDLAVILINMGACLSELRRFDEARAALERALAVDTAAFGADDPRVAADWSNLGALARDRGDLAGALVDLDRARAILATLPDSRELAHVEYTRGEALRGLGRAPEAIASLERALTLGEVLEIPTLVPHVAAALADLLWTTGGDRLRARALAETARDGFAADASEAEAAAAAARWLVEHPAPPTPTH